MRVYIAGKMRGVPEFNYPAFHEAAARWRARGWEVVNPAELDGADGGLRLTPDGEVDIAYYMKRDVAELVKCDAIALIRHPSREAEDGRLIPGWEESQGASVEFMLSALFKFAMYDADTYATILPVSASIEIVAQPGHGVARNFTEEAIALAGR